MKLKRLARDSACASAEVMPWRPVESKRGGARADGRSSIDGLRQVVGAGGRNDIGMALSLGPVGLHPQSPPYGRFELNMETRLPIDS